MNKRTLELWVGLFVLLGAAGLVFLSLKAANLTRLSSAGGYQVVAKFDNIGGLKPRAPVRAAGVHVGQVKAIALDKNTFQGLVTLEIDSRYAFPKDTSAQIQTAGLLGDQYVALQAGATDDNLAAGDTITHTQSALVLENLIGQFLFSKAADAGTPAATPAPTAAP